MSRFKILFLLPFLTVNSLLAESEKLENELLTQSIVTSTAVGRSYLNNIYIYGVGTKSDDDAYNGFGLKYDSDVSYYNFEKHVDYNKSVFIQRFDINEKLYQKFGFGHLDKKETVFGNEEFVQQLSSGISLGFGDSNTYNFEMGYIANRLNEAFSANTYTDTLYVEVVFKEDFDFGSVDTTISFQTSKAYDKIQNNYTSSLGYYPIDDVKTTIKYTSDEHTEDEYNVKAGLNYKFKNLSEFSTGSITPLLTATMNNSSNVQTMFDYKYNISNRSLKIKDKFKELISTASIFAKQLNPSEFLRRTTD